MNNLLQLISKNVLITLKILILTFIY